jgi:hypothetical protein
VRNKEMMKLEYVTGNKNIIRASQEQRRTEFLEEEKTNLVLHRLTKRRLEQSSASKPIERKTTGGMFMKSSSRVQEGLWAGRDTELKASTANVTNKKEYISEANIVDPSLHEVLQSRPVTLESKQPRNVVSAFSDPKSKLTKTTNFTRK